MPVCTRRGSIVGGSERKVTLVSEDSQSMCVLLCAPDANDECPLTLDPIADDSLSFLGDVGCSKLKSFYKHAPVLRKMTLPCGHSFGALNLVYHFARNSMFCPCCRDGLSGRLRASSLPLHLRAPIYNRALSEKRNQLQEELEEDRLVAEALSESTQNQSILSTVFGLRSIVHSDVHARLVLYSSESGEVDSNRQQVAAAELKPLVYDSLYGLIVLQTDFFDRPASGNVAITVTGSTENNSPVVSMTEAFPVEAVPNGAETLHYSGVHGGGYLRLITGSRGMFQVADYTSEGAENVRKMQIAWYVDVETMIRVHPGCVEVLGVAV